jgi:hypothetical protein
MRKIYQGILCIIVGSAILISFWVLAHYFLVGGTQEVIIGGVKHTDILTPAPISIPAPIAYFLFFGGIGLIIFGILRLLQIKG